jgi:colicin import membrane protein
MGNERDDALSGALDRLYAVPLETFVVTRRALADELRAQGDTRASQAVAAAAKPTRTDWALNQVARTKPALVRSLIEARDAAAQAQARGDADELRAATREYRSRVADVVREVRATLEEAHAQASLAQLRRIGETLQAATAEHSDARGRLLRGQLVRDVDIDDPFAGLIAGPASSRQLEPPAPARSTSHQELARKRAAERERAQRQAAQQAAAERVAELEEAARRARAAAREAETASVRAHDEAQRARREADQAEAHLQKAREELRAIRD